MKDSAFIIDKTDPRGLRVCFTKRQWYVHVTQGDGARPGHTIMLNNEGAVKRTIEDPDVIAQSKTHPDRDVYFEKAAGGTYSDSLYTKVVVEVAGGEGKGVTAWPQREISGNIGELKYVKPKL